MTCPHDDCRGEINVPRDLPAGVYDCVCKATKLRLSWDTYLTEGRKPRLSVDPKATPTSSPSGSAPVS